MRREHRSPTIVRCRRFANQLKIPPLLQPRVDGTGRKIFDLHLQQDTSELLAGKPKGHDFRIAAAAPAVQRHMSVTGG